MFEQLLGNDGVLAALLAVAALIVSIISFFHSKRQVYADIIAVKRFEWMNDLRVKYTAFIEVYCSRTLFRDEKLEKLKQKRFEIELYLDNRFEEYQNIIRGLDRCIENIRTGETMEIPDELILAIQATFSHTHKRAKREAGISASMEKRMRAEILGKEENKPPEIIQK